MKKPSLIDSRQLVAMLVMSRIFSLCTFRPFSADTVNGSVVLLALLFSFAAEFALIIPCMLFLKKHPNMGLMEACYQTSRPLGHVVAALLLLLCLFIAGETVGQFEYFMTTAIYPYSTNMVFAVLLSVVASYFVMVGIEAFSRTALLLFVVTIAAFAVLFCTLIEQVQLVNVVSPFFYGTKDIIRSTVTNLFHNVEVIACVALAPYIKGGIGKAFIRYNIWILGLFELITFIAVTVLGDFAGTRMFPIYTLSAIAGVSFVERLDSLYTCIWIFMALIKATLYLFLAVRACSFLVANRMRPVLTPICGLLMLGLAIVLSNNIHLFTNSYLIIASGLPVLLMMLVIPILAQVIILCKARRGKR